jgi:hypothetical protein
MTAYKVLAVKPSGKDDPKFGTEFYVKLDNDDVARLWFKAAPTVGQELDLEKGPKGYKKVKKEWNPQSGGSTAPASKPFTKAPYKDNSLGMRIGMTVNNAANYVNSLDIRDANGEPKILTPEEWATTVGSYAIELFHATDDTNFTEEVKKPAIEGEHVVLDENPFL